MGWCFFLNLKLKKMTTAKKVLLDELIEYSHVEIVEDVIFWALQNYCSDKKNITNGRLVANAIMQRIIDSEKSEKLELQNEETINYINKN